MPDAADDARRRELQRRAFAPDGRLTDAEAAELRALSAPAAPEPVTAQGAPEPVTVPAMPEPAAARPAASADAEVPSASPRRTGDTPASAMPHERARRDQGIPILILAAAVAVLLGLGAGWLLFGRADSTPAMTDAQRSTLVQLDAAEEYDPGSIVLVGEKDGAEAWYATRKADELECLVLIVGDDRQTACERTGQANSFGLQANANTVIDEQQVVVWAVLLEDAEGEMVAVIQRETGEEEYDWRSQYTGRDLEIAEFVDANGYPGDSLQLVGYDDALPIWMTFSGDEFCMIVAEPTALIAHACSSFDADAGGRMDLRTDRATYQLNLSSTADPTLTIVRTPDSIVCDVDSGYCGVDDRTGDSAG